ncbi:hypothetical protein DNU06_16285 [Putridiphycobacter roseus]|uniref:Lipoprotein n=1 Tax=Putridiphycobacter roseus TaxID=2219161 RepID=A0A2W1MXD6_9FLAO|nr:hypothetical protein [Putridiphycobacter roseus]PZE15830.1 hypothetical protein DNU06_16285 [Putridiphycobacter roseus]
MKTIKVILFFTLSLVFLSTSCEKQDPEPVFTQGFSCKINGVEWVAKTPTSISGPVPLFVDYIENTGELYLTGTKKDNDVNIYQVISIYLVNIYQKGEFKIETLKGNGEESVGFLSLSNNIGCAGYLHDSLNPGDIEICKFDKTKREIEGKFNMTLINRDCTDSLMYITDGQFALRY